MVCLECGQVLEFYLPELEAVQNTIAARYNFQVTQHSLRIVGLCETCQQAAGKELSETIAGGHPKVRVTSDGRYKRSHQV